MISSSPFVASMAATIRPRHRSTASTAFVAASEEIIVGLDRTRDALVRAVAVDSETGSDFNLVADDQFSIRQQRIGYYGALEEGRMVLDNRALVGLIM